MKLKYTYKTKGVCSRQIDFEIEDNKIRNVKFVSGCDGNLKAISKLIEAMEIKDVIEKLKDITCGSRKTSCPAQLANALREIL